MTDSSSTDMELSNTPEQNLIILGDDMYDRARRAEFKRLEEVIEEGLGTTLKTLTSLLIIHEEKLYKEAYGSFRLYCAERWGISYRSAYRFIALARQNEDESGQTGPDEEKKCDKLSHFEDKVGQIGQGDNPPPNIDVPSKKIKLTPPQRASRTLTKLTREKALDELGTEAIQEVVDWGLSVLAQQSE